MNRLSSSLMAAALLPGMLACGKTAATAVGAGAAAAAAIAYNDRGASTRVGQSVSRTADVTEKAFKALGIQLTERKNESDGIELKGTQGEWKIVVDIERDPGNSMSELEVSVSKDQVNYSKDRAEEILRAILERS